MRSDQSMQCHASVLMGTRRRAERGAETSLAARTDEGDTVECLQVAIIGKHNQALPSGMYCTGVDQAAEPGARRRFKNLGQIFANDLRGHVVDVFTPIL